MTIFSSHVECGGSPEGVEWIVVSVAAHPSCKNTPISVVWCPATMLCSGYGWSSSEQCVCVCVLKCCL